MARMTYDELKQNALALTSLYETSNSAPNCFGVVAGNFDGAGISFGAIQFNFISGTLQPILKRMFENHTNIIKTAFKFATNPTDYNTLYDVVYNRTNANQVSWGNSISVSTNKHKVIEPWNTYFKNLGLTQECINEQMVATQWYFDLALTWFNKYGLWSRRAYALFFDIAVQSGGISTTTDTAILNAFASLNIVNKTKEQIETEKMQIVANKRADAITSQWQKSYRERKLSIANGSGYVYNGSLFMDTTRYGMTLMEAFPPEKALRVYIDAGYGGADLGGTFPNGTFGKDITLDIAYKLRSILLSRYTNVDVYMSRTADIDKSLINRANEAHDWGANYLVSIRLNTDVDTTKRGFRSVAVNNFVDPPADVFWYQGLVHDGIQKYVKWSTDLGKGYLNDTLVDNLDIKHIVTLNGFISNTEDQALLLDEAFREKIAEGHAKGLQNAYISEGVGEAWDSVDKSKHIFGIDVSSYQNTYYVDGLGKTVYNDIDWSKVVAQGTKFAYIRSVGSDHGLLVNGKYQVSAIDTSLKQDGAFKQNCKKAREKGLPVGAYYFANAVDSGKSQNLIPQEYIDLETSPTLYPTSRAVIDTKYVKSGTKSLKLLAKTTASDSYGFLGTTLTDNNIPLIAGQKYLLSFYAYAEKDASIQCHLRLDTGVYATASTRETIPANQWTRVTREITIPTNATKGIARVDCDQIDTEVWFDDFMLEKLTTKQTTFHGVAVGGNFTGDFKINTNYTGAVNPAEIRVDTTSGNSFTHPNATVYTITADKEIGTHFENVVGGKTGIAYIMFVGSDKTRITKPYTSYSDDFVVAFYQNGNWYQDANGTDVLFTPNANDCIVGEVGRTSSTINGLNIYTNFETGFASPFHKNEDLISDATNQANHFADILEECFGLKKWGDLYPMLDFESYSQMVNLSAEFIRLWIEKFKDTFETRMPTKLGLYTGSHFLNSKAGFNSEFSTKISSMPLWVANYSYNTDPFNNPMVKVGTWNYWTVWQYASDPIDRNAWGVATDELDLNYAMHLSYLKKPSKPTEIFIDFIDNKLRFNWAKSDDKDIARFEVLRDGTYFATVNATDNFVLDATVITDRTYVYKVQAIDTLGEMTESNEVTITIEETNIKNAPSPPTNLNAVPWFESVTLTWTLSDDGNLVNGYNIYMDGKWIAWVNGTTNTYVVRGLTNEVTYSFALDCSSDAYPNVSVKTTPVSAKPYIPIEIPNIPENVKAEVQNNMDVIISWENVPKYSFSHFAIAINGDITHDLLQEKTFTLKNWPRNTPTRINIIVYNIADDSVWSEDTHFSILYPSSPKDLVAIPNDKEITLKWTPNTETFIKGYNLFLDGNFHGFTTDPFYVFTWESIVHENDESFEVMPLINGKTYRVGVKAVSIQADIESTLETKTSIPIRVFPNPPTYVALEVVAENNVKVSWEYIAKERFSHFAVALNGTIIANNITDQFYNIISPFPVRTEQTVNVIAYDTDGDTSWSKNEYFRIEKPSVPIGLNVKISDRSLNASWFPNVELYVTGYNVYLNGALYGNTDKSSMKITGLTNGTSYNIQIVAVGKQFSSTISEIASGIPVLDLPNKPRIVDYRILGTGEIELTLDHVQKVDHLKYELFLDGAITVANTSTVKSISTPVLIANQQYIARVEAVDIHADRSGLSDPFTISFTAETLEYIKDNTLALGEIDETLEPVKPQIFLCKPNKQTIGVISEFKALNHIIRLGDLNEITFEVPFLVDREDVLVENPLINILRERFIIRIELNGNREHYLINSISDQSSNDGEFRSVHGYSLGYELSNYEVRDFKKTGYAKDILEEVLGETPWQLATGLSDSNSFFNTSSDQDGSGGRTFDISRQSVLEFVKEVATAFGAIIVWNTETRSIDFRRSEDIGENKGLRISYDKYLKSISKEVNGDEMVTRLYPIGEENLNIRSVNPTQSPYIEDYSFFLYPFERDGLGNVIQSSNYMSDELAGAILDYQTKLDGYRETYAERYQTLRGLEDQKIALDNQLDELELQRDIVQGSVDRLKLQEALVYHEFTYNATEHTITHKVSSAENWVAVCKITDTVDFTIKYESLTVPMVANQWKVLGKVNAVTELDVNFTGINPNVYVELYFIELVADEFTTVGNEQQILEKYLLEVNEDKVDAKEDEISAKQTAIDTVNQDIRNITIDLSLSENFTDAQLDERKLFIVTRNYENANINNAEELYREALKEFVKLRTPQIQINIDIVNFLSLVEAQNDWDKLAIGDTIRILDERLKIDFVAKILEISINYDDNAIQLQIASADEIKTDQEKFMDSIYKAVSTSTTVDIRKYDWDKVSENTREIQSWIEGEFDATKKKIIGGTNESIEISQRGLLIKDKNDKENFLVAQHKVIAITNDGGKTFKNALTPDGLIAERLVGRIIAGENLIIENENGNFRIDRDGITVKSFALRIEGGLDQRNLGIDTSGLKGTYDDWNKTNNKNDTIPSAPIVLIDGTAIDHVDTSDDTVDISFSWDYDASTVEGDIDGFMIYVHSSNVSADYEFGFTPSREIQVSVNPTKRSIILRNVSKRLYYTFGIEAYRIVDKSINVTGVLKSAIIKPQIREEKPYYPLAMKGQMGTIYATLDPSTTTEMNSIALNAVRQGVSYNNVTIDANTGLSVKNSQDTTRTVMNATDGIAIFTRKDPSVATFDKVFYVDTNGRLTAEKLIAKALEIVDKNGRKIIDANEGVLNLRNLERIEGQEVLNKITIGAETIFESGYNPKVLGTLFVVDSPVWNSSFVYHTTVGFGLHLRAYGDVNLSSCTVYSSGNNTGTIILRRKDTGVVVKRVYLTLSDGANNIVLDMELKKDISSYWLGTEIVWSGAGVARTTNTQTTFPYNAGDFVIEDGGLYDKSNGSGFYYYFYDILASGKGVKGYLANDKTLSAIRVRGTTLINGNFLQTGTVLAEALVLKGRLDIRKNVNGIEESTFKIDQDGTVTVSGNIYMKGGSILWGLDPANQDVIKGFAYITDTDGISRLYLDADHIKTGSFSFNRGKGGFLTLGGNFLKEENNIRYYENGVLSVFSSNPERGEIARLDGDYGGFGSLKIDKIIDTRNIIFKPDPDSPNIDTSGNMIIYVDPIHGNDFVTTKGTSDDPFKSLQIAINSIPKYLDRDVYVYYIPTLLHSDTAVAIEGFVGLGTIYLRHWDLEIRYIRDWANGSTANVSNHWVEIEVIKSNGTKVSGLSEHSIFTNRTDDIQKPVPIEQRTFIQGIVIGGAFTGQFLLNQSMDGTPNNGEIRVDTSTGNRFFHPNGTLFYVETGAKEISTSIEDGSPSIGAYIAYIGSDKTRFTYPFPQSHRDFMVISWNGTNWQYNDNASWITFTPNANDCLVAQTGRVSGASVGLDILNVYLTSPHGVRNMGRVVDNDKNTNLYFDGGPETNYLTIYLGGGYKDISRINVFHYYAGERTYYGTKTEVSSDGTNWYALYDSARMGEYPETSTGNRIFADKATLRGNLRVRHNMCAIVINDLYIDATGTGQFAVLFENSRHNVFEWNLVKGDKNVAHAVYALAHSNLMCWRNEINYASISAITARDGSHIEVYDVKGGGFPYAMESVNSSVIAGGHNAPVGDTGPVSKVSGGQITGTWNHIRGEFSPIPEAPPPPPPPTVVQRTKTWYSTGGDAWNESANGWHIAEDDVLQGKYSSYGLYRGLWFFPTDMRNTCYNAIEIKQVRVYITRLNQSGNVGGATHQLRTHGYTSKPSSIPNLSNEIVNFTLSRGQSTWLDITGTFAGHFKGGGTYGIGLYTGSTNSGYYTRCSNVARIEVTYTENA